MRRLILLLALVALSLGARASSTDLPDGLYAEFTTPRGAFVAELYYQKTPMTVASFVGRVEGSLAPRNGQPYYAGLIWYRVVPNFVIQSGDPVRSAAKPGEKVPEEGENPVFPFPDEIAPGLHHSRAGTLSMANSGPDTNSSDFFVTLRDTDRLNYLHSVFGQVIRGVELLAQVKENEPFSIRIVRVGAAAKAFDASEAAFTARVAAAKQYAGAKEPGPTTHFDDADKLLPLDPPRAKNFNFKLANFERFTGRKIYARMFKEFRPAREGQKLGEFHRELAEQLGVAKDGVLVSYFADRDQWAIWIADPLLSALPGQPGQKLHERKEAFFAGARERGAKFAAGIIAEGRTLTDAQKLKLVVDEVVDGLIFLYEPKP